MGENDPYVSKISKKSLILKKLRIKLRDWKEQIITVQSNMIKKLNVFFTATSQSATIFLKSSWKLVIFAWPDASSTNAKNSYKINVQMLFPILS